MKFTMLAGAASILLVLLLVALGTSFVSLRMAEGGCETYGAVRGYTSIGYEWSWSKFGTTCTFDDTVTITRLFW
ncbi:hypothetical protein GCM10023340_09790 [Nocardioides marinquilinus]|uniref:Uncharacterized protein n=1 Tax=Nocardioides marinquilinus TaxID=1210400 RepID=A0ABP9PCV3_9ACTN